MGKSVGGDIRPLPYNFNSNSLNSVQPVAVRTLKPKPVPEPLVNNKMPNVVSSLK